MASRMEGFFRWFEPGGKQRLLPMEGVRGLAVLLVFFVHYAGTVATGGLQLNVEQAPLQDMPGIWRKFMAWLFFSHHGVHLFFILSGFLICRMVTARAEFDYPRFMLGRFLRIYPAFLASLALCMLWYVYGPAKGSIETRTLLANLVFLNALPALGFYGYNHVTWSLFMEFVFYLVFPVLLLLRPKGMFRDKWMLVAAAFLLVYGTHFFGYLYAPYLLFFSGAFIAQFDDADLRRFATAQPDGFVLGAYLFVTTARAMQWFDFHSFVLLFTVTGALLVIQACYGNGFLRRIFEWAPLRFLGNISYSFYLLHSLVLSVLVRIVWDGKLQAFSDKGQALLLFVIGFAAALLLSAALFLACERPYFARKGHREPQVVRASA